MKLSRIRISVLAFLREKQPKPPASYTAYMAACEANMAYHRERYLESRPLLQIPKQ